MKEISLSRGMVALVDDEDFEYLSQWKWYAKKMGRTFYAVRNGAIMHRVIIKTPQGLKTDHIDHNGLNNQRSNLRIVTSHQNRCNVSACGRSKYLGVIIRKRGSNKHIYACIKYNRKHIHIGRFSTEEAAALAYNEAALRYHGEYANLNKV